MSKRRAMRDQFMMIWDIEDAKIRQISKHFPNQLLLKVEDYDHRITDKLKDELFQLLWNMRLREYILKRIKDEMFKASKNKAEYADWRTKLMTRANYYSEHVGFDRISNMTKLTSVVKYHKWSEAMNKAIESKPESYVTDVLKAYANTSQIKQFSMTLGSIVYSLKPKAGNKTAPSSRSRHDSRDSISIDHLKAMDNMKTFFRKRTTVFNDQITPKLMKNIILAIVEHYLNREGKAF